MAMDRQSTKNAEAVPVLATSPIQNPTLAPKKQSGSAPVLGMQDKGMSLQVPSDVAFARMEQHGSASDLSESEQYTLQDLGWSSSRRGLEASNSLKIKSSSSQSSISVVLKDFWGHFSGLSWLPYQKQMTTQNKLVHYYYPEGQTAGQHAKHEAFKLAQQVLQQAATDTAYFQSRRHIDGMNAKYAIPSQQHEPSAGHMMTKRSGLDELLHSEIIQDPGARDQPIPAPHTQGRND